MQAALDHFFPSQAQREQEHSHSNSSNGSSSKGSSSSSSSTRATAPPPPDPFATLGLAKVCFVSAFARLPRLTRADAAGVAVQLLRRRAARGYERGGQGARVMSCVR